MRRTQVDHSTVPNPKMRRWFSAAFRSVRHAPMIHGLIEVDVTRADDLIREHRESTGESLSFTAFIVGCLAGAVEENRAVQAFRKGNRHLVLFDDVDVYVMIERDVAGGKVPIPYIVRAAHRKTLRELHDEIRSAQAQDADRALRWLQHLPDLLFRPFMWLFPLIGRRRPQVWKKYVGTVGISAVGMFAEGAGWGIPPALPTLMITLGGIGAKPAVVDGHIVMRDHLSVTISADHNILDGAPAARFTERLKELIETGHGLPAATVRSARAGADSATGAGDRIGGGQPRPSAPAWPGHDQPVGMCRTAAPL